MNIRRGTFRLWVILSVLFVIGVAAFSYSDIHTEFRKADTDWNAELAKYGGISLVPADCEKTRGILGTDYTRDADGVCWYEFSKLRSLYPEYKDIRDKELDKRLYAKAGKPLVVFHPWAKIAKAAAIAVGAPLAILDLGYALFWALAGFKHQPVNVPAHPRNTRDAHGKNASNRDRSRRVFCTGRNKLPESLAPA